MILKRIPHALYELELYELYGFDLMYQAIRSAEQIGVASRGD